MLLSENVLQDKYNLEQGGYTGQVPQKGQVDLPSFKAHKSIAKMFFFFMRIIFIWEKWKQCKNRQKSVTFSCNKVIFIFQYL